ncbi:hypothetical protein ACLMJK_004596 [Lecanora helva]
MVTVGIARGLIMKEIDSRAAIQNSTTGFLIEEERNDPYARYSLLYDVLCSTPDRGAHVRAVRKLLGCMTYVVIDDIVQLIGILEKKFDLISLHLFKTCWLPVLSTAITISTILPPNADHRLLGSGFGTHKTHQHADIYSTSQNHTTKRIDIYIYICTRHNHSYLYYHEHCITYVIFEAASINQLSRNTYANDGQIRRQDDREVLEHCTRHDFPCLMQRVGYNSPSFAEPDPASQQTLDASLRFIAHDSDADSLAGEDNVNQDIRLARLEELDTSFQKKTWTMPKIPEIPGVSSAFFVQDA